METTYWALAVMGTTVFVFKLGLMFVGLGDQDLGDTGDVDVAGDFDGDGVVGHGDQSTMAFMGLSIQSVSTFFMGAGWMGLVAMNQWSLDPMATSLCAAGFGFFCVFLLGKMLQQAMRLESSGTLDNRKALGKTGKVYVSIKADRPGQVQLEVQGRLVTLEARSADGDLDTGTTIRVNEVDSSGVLVVSAV